MDQLIFVRKAYIPNFRPLVPFLHVKKFVVVGGGSALNIQPYYVSDTPILFHIIEPVRCDAEVSRGYHTVQCRRV